MKYEKEEILKGIELSDSNKAEIAYIGEDDSKHLFQVKYDAPLSKKAEEAGWSGSQLDSAMKKYIDRHDNLSFYIETPQEIFIGLDGEKRLEDSLENMIDLLDSMDEKYAEWWEIEKEESIEERNPDLEDKLYRVVKRNAGYW
ncbi:MAG: hypothetical protein MUP58_00985 [Candidatus Nanohaloarchaeota archaeon QJJ-9]|nr:hypothetical protein [Candidatus Nanohaloarchaeota archaeon QJJ-9]